MASSGSKSNTVVRDAEYSAQALKLTSYLNELIEKLGIPITIEAPYELTPSLLLAVLECLTRRRLPIPQTVRRARDTQAKIQAMKIFLGVLESDVLQEDVGLSDVDPRRLAAGEWEEVVLVGEILCWLGKTYGHIPHADVAQPGRREDTYDNSTQSSWHETFHGSRHPRVREASVQSSALIDDSSLSMMQVQSAALTNTTVLSEPPDVGHEPETPSLSALDLFDAPSRIGVYRTSTPPPAVRTPRNGNLDEDFPARPDVSTSYNPLNDAESTVEDASTFCDCPSDAEPESPLAHKSRPVRRSGWIEEADDEAEVRAYLAARQTRTSTRVTTPGSTPRAPSFAAAAVSRTPYVSLPPGRVVTRHTSPTQYTLALLTERAKLLEELANLKRAAGKTPPSRRSQSSGEQVQ